MRIHKITRRNFMKVAGVSALAMGLAACGGDEGKTSTPPASQPVGTEPSGEGETVEISLWSFNIGGFTEASNWDSLIAAFNEKYPNVTVTVNPINYQDGDQKLTTAITGVPAARRSARILCAMQSKSTSA